MTQDEARKYLTKNKKLISLMAVANELDIDVSNFHKFVKGELNLKPDKMAKLGRILRKLCPKVEAE